MAKINVQVNLRGLNRLMASDRMQALVDRRGAAMAAAAGENFEYVSRRHKWTARGFVRPANAEGRREEAREKRLNRALGAGG